MIAHLVPSLLVCSDVALEKPFSSVNFNSCMRKEEAVGAVMVDAMIYIYTHTSTSKE